MKQQIRYYLGLLGCVPLLPWLYWQGQRVRATVPRLPEADGDEGRTLGDAEPLHLLTLGESTVAGVGVRTHVEGLTGWIARRVTQRTGVGVSWKALGRSGYTARQVRDGLVPLMPAGPVDLLVVGLGGNDTFKLHSPLRWKRDMIGLIEAIRRRLPDCPILIANLPPVYAFPAFPRSMQQVLGGLVRLHGDAIQDLPLRFPDVHYASRRIRVEEWIERSETPIGLSDLFSDGVHPSSLTYRFWGEDLVDLALEQGILDSRPAPKKPE